MELFRKKNIESIKESSKSSTLAKELTAVDLVFLGLGAIIGTGVFLLTGLVASNYAGPAVIISYCLAGICCIFIALSYAELGASVPTSGSVYSYSYVAFGKIFAWILSGILFLEFLFGASAVASSWSGYFTGILEAAQIHLPSKLTYSYMDGGIINLPAIFIISFCGLVLYLGTSDSKKLNIILVIAKIVAIAIFIILAIPNFNSANWTNFMPFGFDGVVRGASILFFSYGGFGIIAASAEECKNPKKDIVLGLIISILLVIVLYAAVGAAATGIAHYTMLDNPQPLAYALKLSGSNVGSIIVAVGAVSGMTTVIMMNIYALSRIFFAVARDGLLPEAFSKVNTKYKSPGFSIISLSLVAILITNIMPYRLVVQLATIGGLIDYIIITFIVMLFRFKYPDLKRAFKCPLLFIIGPIAFCLSFYLLIKQLFDANGNLLDTGKFLGVWILAYTLLYFIIKPFIKNHSNEL